MHHYGYNLKVWNYIQKVHASYRHLQEQSEVVVVVEAHEEHLQTSGVIDVHLACYQLHVEPKVADIQPWVKKMVLMMQLPNVAMALRVEVAERVE